MFAHALQLNPTPVPVSLDRDARLVEGCNILFSRNKSYVFFIDYGLSPTCF